MYPSLVSHILYMPLYTDSHIHNSVRDTYIKWDGRGAAVANGIGMSESAEE